MSFDLSNQIVSSSSVAGRMPDDKPTPMTDEAKPTEKQSSDWPATIRAVGFYSLLEQLTQNAWMSALRLARSLPDRGIDLSLLPTAIDRKSPLYLWFSMAAEPSNTNASDGLLADMYDELVRHFGPFDKMAIDLAYNDANRDSAGAVGIHALAHLNITDPRRWTVNVARTPATADSDTSPSAIDVRRITTLLQIPRTDIDDGNRYNRLNDASHNPMYLSMYYQRIDLLTLLFERLPVIELQVYFRPNDNRSLLRNGWHSVDAWYRSYFQNERCINLDRLLETAQSYMNWYRRQRKKLMRTVLADIPFPVSDIIDSYGLPPPYMSFSF